MEWKGIKGHYFSICLFKPLHSTLCPLCSFFPDDGESVAQRQNHLLGLSVSSHMLVKKVDAARLMVAAIGFVNHMAVPKRVVGQQESAFAEQREHRLVSLHIRPLVAIYESHIELDAQLWRQFVGVADAKINSIGHRRLLNPRPSEILHLVVHLERVDATALLQPLSHTDSAISAERPHFQNVLRTNHLHQHLQQPTLQMATHHSSMNGVNIRGAPKPIQIIGLGLYMRKDVILQLVLHREQFFDLLNRQQCLNSQPIGVEPEAGNHAQTSTRDHRAMAELLAFVHVGNMNLHHRALQRANAVLQGDARMGVGTCVEHDAVGLEAHLLQLVDQLTLDVALVIGNLHIGELGAKCGQKLVERRRAVDAWLTRAQQIQVRSVDDLNLLHTNNEL